MHVLPAGEAPLVDKGSVFHDQQGTGRECRTKASHHFKDLQHVFMVGPLAIPKDSPQTPGSPHNYKVRDKLRFPSPGVTARLRALEEPEHCPAPETGRAGESLQVSLCSGHLGKPQAADPADVTQPFRY